MKAVPVVISTALALVIAIGCLIGYYVNDSINANYTETTGFVVDHSVKSHQCSYECHCHDDCRTDKDGHRHCTRHCDTCYYTCYDGVVYADWDCTIDNSTASLCEGYDTVVSSRDSRGEVYDYMLHNYPIGKNITLYAKHGSNPTRNPENGMMVSLWPTTSVWTASMVFFGLSGFCGLYLLCGNCKQVCCRRTESRYSAPLISKHRSSPVEYGRPGQEGEGDQRQAFGGYGQEGEGHGQGFGGYQQIEGFQVRAPISQSFAPSAPPAREASISAGAPGGPSVFNGEDEAPYWK